MKKVEIENAVREFGLKPAERNGVRGLTANCSVSEIPAEVKAAKAEILAYFDEKEAKAKAQIEAEKIAKEERINKIKNDEIEIELSVNPHDYHVSINGIEAIEVLRDLGLYNEYVGVDLDVVNKLGKSFKYSDAKKYADNLKAERAAENEASKVEKENESKNVFEKAAQTGKKQVLSMYSEICNGKVEDCDVDNIVTYAMPDGSQKIERVHCY